MWIVAHQLAIPSGTNQILKNSIVYIFTDIHIVCDLHLVEGVNQWSSEFISTSVASRPYANWLLRAGESVYGE